MYPSKSKYKSQRAEKKVINLKPFVARYYENVKMSRNERILVKYLHFGINSPGWCEKIVINNQENWKGALALSVFKDGRINISGENTWGQKLYPTGNMAHAWFRAREKGLNHLVDPLWEIRCYFDILELKEEWRRADSGNRFTLRGKATMDPTFSRLTPTDPNALW